MNPVLVAFFSIFGGFLAGSGGFWMYLRSKYEKEDCINKLIMGLAHDKIVYLGIKYIEQGYVTKDQYDDLFKYFWEPYSSLGGNGSAERIVRMVQLLPLNPERRIDPDIREATEKLISGTDKVIDRVVKGDDTLERGK